jgi:radical SAM protein with 4Fe4S-binding SPASM domain
MEYQEYGDWSLGVHQRVSTKRVPISGSIEVTQRCNNQCLHCYNNLPAGDPRARAEELSLDEYRRIIDELVDAGCLWLLFTGGEIFVRKDFFDIYTYARRKGLLITLFTNGTLITSDIAAQLAQTPPFYIEITIYGATPKTYESITGVPGSYARCIHGINLLMDRSLPLKLKTMAITRNRHEIDDMKRLAQDSLGLEFKFDAMINPRLDCSKSPLDVRLTPADVVKLDLLDPERAAEWKQFAGRFNRAVDHPDRENQLYVCGAGNNSFAIDPYGRLSVCVLSSAHSYNLRNGSFKEGWHNFLAAERRKKTLRQTKCTACSLKSMCGMCPANSELECSDQEAPVDYLCQVAHLRAYALDLPTAPHGDCEYCEGGSRYEQMIRTAKELQARFTPQGQPKPGLAD